MITIDYVKQQVAEISRNTRDDEGAHGSEDALWFEVLEAIAQDRCEDPARCAAEAIKTAELDFERWCA